MKKRKPPILLATLLLVLLGVFIIINRPPAKEPNPGQQPPDTSEAVSHEGDKPGEVSQGIKSAMNGTSSRTPNPSRADGPKMLTPPGSKVTIPEIKPEKPTPDESMVQSLRGAK